MSKNKNRTQKIVESAVNDNSIAIVSDSPANRQPGSVARLSRYFRQRLWLVGIIALVSVGAMGAGLKFLEEDARVRGLTVRDGSKSSWLDSVNPFLAAPLPTPTPQLSREYIYAGSRLLAVEDANANAAPPADLAIWRPSTGVWWVLGGPGSQQTIVQWGQAGDKAVPGDYDGDGKTDFSVFRPSNNIWYIVNSSNGATGGINFGTSGDLTAQADYDGDGKTDAAVLQAGRLIFRESSNEILLNVNLTGEGIESQPPPIISGFTPPLVAPGDTVTVSGQYFTRATEVKIGNNPVAFQIVNDTKITIEAETTSGKITVTTLFGTVLSANILRVVFRPPRD